MTNRKTNSPQVSASLPENFLKGEFTSDQTVFVVNETIYVN